MMDSSYYIQDNTDIENKKLETAMDLYRKGNYTSALTLYLDLAKMSYSYKLYYEIGRCYYKLNDFDNALLNFTRSVELEFFKNPSYVFLGNIYYKQENFIKAIENWCTAQNYKPEDESVCLNLATSCFAKDMKLQSIFYYEKYLKYARDKTSKHYLEIKNSINEFIKQGKEFYNKALRAIQAEDNKTAIQALEYAVKVSPNNFDSNFLLAKLYMEEKQYMQALVYLKQSYCLDKKSLDVLERLSAVLIILGDYTSAYCCSKRILPLVIDSQKEYLETLKNIKQLEEGFDTQSAQAHKNWGDLYYNECNYHLALFEYENAIIVNNNLSEQLSDKIQKIKLFLNPEERIIKACFEKGLTFYSTGDFKTANKYFTKIMVLADETSSDYKYAKSRLVN